MRARIVPPYPSFTYVMSHIDDPPHESQAGSQRGGTVSAKPESRPYSKYDDNPLMRTVRHDHDEPVYSSVPASTTHSRSHHSCLHPPRPKPQMSLPLVGKFLQKHASALSQRRKVSSAV